MPECSKTYELRLPALEIQQSDNRSIYTFAVDGKLISQFTTVSRIKREDKAINGYQRPEVLAHVSAIKSYIESSNPMVPNAVVVAFNETVSFEPANESFVSDKEYVQSGHLVIPVDENLPDEKKPGWIVDGQQRCAAVREADLDFFPLCVNAFIASEDEQRTQFILVNSTKPLPKGLIYELLPSTNGHLPTALVKKRLPSLLLQHLNYDEDSPFWQLIQTPTTPEGVIKDNSILRMLENSLTDGCLYHYHDRDTGEADIEGMLAVLNSYWNAVKQVFELAWGQPPRRSRLMHGVGILSMGFLMDAITYCYVSSGEWPDYADYVTKLDPLKDLCSWTEGFWKFGSNSLRLWNELQNTSSDIQLLTTYLLSKYELTSVCISVKP